MVTVLDRPESSGVRTKTDSLCPLGRPWTGTAHMELQQSRCSPRATSLSPRWYSRARIVQSPQPTFARPSDIEGMLIHRAYRADEPLPSTPCPRPTPSPLQHRPEVVDRRRQAHPHRLARLPTQELPSPSPLTSRSFPRLIGPSGADSKAPSRTSPSMRSSTKQKDRVCEPSP